MTFIFSLSKIVQPETNLSKEELTPRNKFMVKDDLQINSLLTTQTHLIVGGVGEIYAYQWKNVKTSKNVQPVWTIDIPGQKGTFDKTDVNCLLYNEENGQIYAGCGDNNIYIFEIESRKILKTLSKHKDFIHCLTIK